MSAKEGTSAVWRTAERGALICSGCGVKSWTRHDRSGLACKKQRGQQRGIFVTASQTQHLSCSHKGSGSCLSCKCYLLEDREGFGRKVGLQIQMKDVITDCKEPFDVLYLGSTIGGMMTGNHLFDTQGSSPSHCRLGTDIFAQNTMDGEGGH